MSEVGLGWGRLETHLTPQNPGACGMHGHASWRRGPRPRRFGAHVRKTSALVGNHAAYAFPHDYLRYLITQYNTGATQV